MRTGVLTVLVLACLAPEGRAQRETIAVYLDGERIEFSSSVTDGPASVIPALLVEGQPMLPVRFLDERLRQGLSLVLFHWGLLQVGPLWFRDGYAEAVAEEAMFGGSVGVRHQLPIAARTIDGRFYVPALPTLDLLGFGVEWSPDERALRITRPTPAGEARPVP